MAECPSPFRSRLSLPLDPIMWEGFINVTGPPLTQIEIGFNQDMDTSVIPAPASFLNLRDGIPQAFTIPAWDAPNNRLFCQWTGDPAFVLGTMELITEDPNLRNASGRTAKPHGPQQWFPSTRAF